MAQLYIGDMHYGHSKVIEYDLRPFRNVSEMNDALVANWNGAVTEADTVYVLGDMFFNQGAQKQVDILQALNGHKILVRGNHDYIKSTGLVYRMFDDISSYLEVWDKDRRVVLCHYPIASYRNSSHGWYHLYAHVHNSKEDIAVRALYKSLGLNRTFNVGAMMPWMNYTPRTLDWLIERKDG